MPDNPTTPENTEHMREKTHDAYIDCLDGGWAGYQGHCLTCGWKGRGPVEKDVARREVVEHLVNAKSPPSGLSGLVVVAELERRRNEDITTEEGT